MKKVLISLAAACALVSAPIAMAQVSITRVDRVAPTDEMYIDMATEAAKANKQAGKPADGAVIILNNAFNASGKASATKTAVQAVLTKSRSPLKFAKIFVVNEPTTEDLNKISERDAREVYFVNSREDAINAGIHAAEEYNDSLLTEGASAIQMFQMDYAPAAALLK